MWFKRFGENSDQKYYELETGERVACDEATIHILWCNWIVCGNARRQDTEEFNIFEFIEPVDLNLLTAERW